MVEAIWQDLSFGLRSMLRAPLTTAAAVISLALGIGATTAMFGALDLWLLRPLPLPEADRLIRVYMANWENGWTGNAFSSRDFVDWRDVSESVDLAAYRRSGSSFAAGGSAARVGVVVASANLLPVLGVQPALGRGFLSEEERVDGPRTVLLSDAFWREWFGADRDAVGRTVVLDGDVHTVVGVLPREADFPEFRGDVWVPLRVAEDEPRAGHSLWAVGRMAEAVSLERAREALGAVASRVAEQDPERTFPGANVIRFRDALYGPEFHQGALVVGAAVLFVLFIACANIAGLLLSRGARRSTELTLRSVLGAGRPRILRQLLTESAALAAIGGASGVGVAYLAVEGLRRWVLPSSLAADPRFGLDGRFLVIAAAASLLATALFGLAPALVGSRIDLRRRVQDGAGAGSGRGLRRVVRFLVVGEVALAMILLVFTGLLTRSLHVMGEADLGFRTEGLLSFAVAAPEATYPSMEEVRGFHARVAERVSAIPGVRALAAASHTPVGGFSSALYRVQNREASPEEARLSAQARWVTHDYASVMGIPLLAGSWFGPDSDTPGAPPSAVISRSLAARHWEGPAAALGRGIELDGRWWTVVGVCADVSVLGPSSSPPATLFRPVAQSANRSRAYVVEIGAPVAPLVAAIRREVQQLDPTLAPYAVSTVADEVRSAMGPQVAMRRILLVVGGVATVLTLVGVYGVTAHSVGLRRREMGLRMAVGARPGEVAFLILGHAGIVTAWGMLLGIAGSLAGGRTLAFALVGVSPWDPFVLVTVTLLVGGAALTAAVEPALRAARVDPVRALRAD